MEIFHTTEEWEQIIGEQFKRLRLLRNIDQRELAARANIALNAVKNLERGKGTLKSFINGLKVLDRVEWLYAMMPEISISPIDILKRHYKPPRQRATGRHGKDGRK